jgi:(p)ppGpp synthase/HD superfamily hydrolase
MTVKTQALPKPPALGTRLQSAFRYAAEKHAGQTRKQTAVPYLSHLMAVASLVLEAGGDEDMAIAALLHDVVEDCGGMPRLREVRKLFGPRVANIVDGCTDSYVEPKPEWLQRKKDYLSELRHADAIQGWFRRLTSCITLEPFWRIIASKGKQFGIASLEKRMARSGTIAP